MMTYNIIDLFILLAVGALAISIVAIVIFLVIILPIMQYFGKDLEKLDDDK